MPQNYQEWYEDLEPAILIKVEDFHLLGYREVKANDIWEFLTEVVWANKPAPLLHERMNDVMQMKIGQLIQFILEKSGKNIPTKDGKLDPELVDAVINHQAKNADDTAAVISDQEGTSHT